MSRIQPEEFVSSGTVGALEARQLLRKEPTKSVLPLVAVAGSLPQGKIGESALLNRPGCQHRRENPLAHRGARDRGSRLQTPVRMTRRHAICARSRPSLSQPPSGFTASISTFEAVRLSNCGTRKPTCGSGRPRSGRCRQERGRCLPQGYPPEPAGDIPRRA